MPDSSPAAILLVGGRGTRLAPLTDLTPKPMLPVGGVPFTLHQILQARSAGIKRIVLATSYLAEVFEPYFGDGSRFDLEIRYAVEKEALGTGGGIRNAAELLDRSDEAPIVIFNGDVLSAHDLAGQIRRHRERDADVTLYLTKVEDARAYGVVPTDGEGWVKAFLEKMENPISDQINAGCYVFRRSVIDEIPSGCVVSVERETFPSLLSTGRRVQGFIDEGYWRDIGTPSALIAASADLITGRFRSPATPTPNSSSGAGYIAPTAQISENVVVAEGSVILDGATIGEGSRILGSIIGEKAVIDAGSVIRTSFVAPHSQIARIDVEGEILGF
jgi:mannose-1-phosphate guanylyltransferase